MMPDKSNELSTYCISTTEEFEKLEECWGNLLAQRHIRSAFLTWEWLFSWWKIFNEGNELWLITIWQNKELIGIAPFMLQYREKYKVKQRVLSSLGVPHIDIGGFILAKEYQALAVSSIVDYLESTKKQWDMLELHEFEVDGIELEYLLPIFSKKGYSIAEKLRNHFYMDIGNDWDAYIMTFSTKLRSDLKRRLRRMNEKGKVFFTHNTGLDITWENITTVFQVSQYGNYPHLYHSQKEKDLHRELFLRMREKKMLDIFLLYFDGQPVAYRYGFHLDKKFEDWRSAFDTRYDKDAPGKVLQLLTFEECSIQGYAQLDFLRGEEEYKKDVPSQINQYAQIRIVPNKKVFAWVLYILDPEIRKKAKIFVKWLKRDQAKSTGV